LPVQSVQAKKYAGVFLQLEIPQHVRKTELDVANGGCSSGLVKNNFLVGLIELNVPFGFCRRPRNRAVNMAIRSMSDWAQYGYADFWASPLQTLGSGAGDCEDYAIVKYVALRTGRVLPDDLRLVIVQNEKRDIGHAVVAVRYEQRWLILDNRTMSILDADDVRDYRPLFALDQQGTRAVATAAVEHVTNR
jgi:Bacterial transglutaminase-like cysteine proteinase BTLCP